LISFTGPTNYKRLKVDNTGGVTALKETPLHPLLDSERLSFLAGHAMVDPYGAPQRTLLEHAMSASRRQAAGQVQASAEMLRLHQLQLRVLADMSSARTSLLVLQARRERLATGALSPRIQDSSQAHLASQMYHLMPRVPPAGLDKSSMLNSNPLTVSSWPNVSSYATAQPNRLVYTKPLDSIPMNAACRVSGESRAATVENNDAPKVTSSQPPMKKRSREVSNGDLDLKDDDSNDLGDASTNDVRFNNYQEGQWGKFFYELKRYRDRMGNCYVPQTYTQNQPLARWVKRQRYQYKLMIDGKLSAMTEERAKALEEIGFVWCSHDSIWAERLEELKEFHRICNHCNVPTNYNENPSLANWVKCQRRQYRLYHEDKSSNMTVQRIRDLDDLGFEWVLRLRQKSSS
jgi:hypothetical protein